MNENDGHIAIIPARSGSKGLPDKNIRMLNGLPLLAWSINAAIQSNIFSRVVLSTDSKEYAATGRSFGAETPWLRDKKLSDDEASSIDVILDVFRHLQREMKEYKWITLLQPTSPLRTAEDIQEAWGLLQSKNGGAVVSVSPVDHPPQWCNLLPEDLSMKNFITPEAMVPRQKLPQYYKVNGAIYMASTETILTRKSFFTPETYAFVMPATRSVDIDTETDFLVAEALFHTIQDDNNG
jgi:CMP-N,N'-diacetyllegionaminic acid synthase